VSAPLGVTDREGRFVADGGIPGVDHYFNFERAGYVSLSTSMNETGYVTGASGEMLPEMTYVLYRGAGAEGLILREDGSPAAETPFHITAYPGEGIETSSNTFTDGDGRFTVLDALPGVPGEIELSLSPDDNVTTGRIRYEGIPGHIIDLGVLRLTTREADQ
jgi:hypothetical protein